MNVLQTHVQIMEPVLISSTTTDAFARQVILERTVQSVRALISYSFFLQYSYQIIGQLICYIFSSGKVVKI